MDGSQALCFVAINSDVMEYLRLLLVCGAPWRRLMRSRCVGVYVVFVVHWLYWCVVPEVVLGTVVGCW